MTSREAEILVVDDEPVNVALLEQVLGRAGFDHVTGATDARDAVTSCVQAPPDLVLLDLRMPYIDGFEVIDLLRERIPEPQLPGVVVLTADITDDVRKRALLVGVDDLMLKPFDLDDVVARVESVLERRSARA
jgi:CheY-like chemotaxis protein